MDLFAHLNYRCSGSSNDARPCVPQQSQGPRVVQCIQPTQNQTHPGDGYIYLDSGRTTNAYPSLDFAASPDVHAQRNSTRGATYQAPTGPMNICYLGEPANMPDQYIPSSSDKITCTDHRPLDEIFGNIRPPSGWPHPKSGAVPIASSHRHTSITYPLPSHPQLDGVVQIPLLALDNQMSGTGLVVDFRRSGWATGARVEGVSMLDLLHNNTSNLENAHQRVFDGFGLADLRLNILWPHCPPFAKMISALGRDGRPITRAELGYEVSLAFADFFYITSQSIPTKPGPYMISSSYLGSSFPGIKYDQLHLISVRNTSRGEWMAEIRAVSVC